MGANGWRFIYNTQMVMDSLLSARIFDSMRLRIDTQRESTMECDRVRESLCVCNGITSIRIRTHRKQQRQNEMTQSQGFGLEIRTHVRNTRIQPLHKSVRFSELSMFVNTLY